jgi:hypothetical protein
MSALILDKFLWLFVWIIAIQYFRIQWGHLGGRVGLRFTGMCSFQKDMALHTCTGDRNINEFHFQLNVFHVQK